MPKFIFQCANCSKSYQKTEDLTGRKVKCGRCKTVFVAQAEPVTDQTRDSPVEQALPWTPTPAHRGKPDTSPQAATAPGAILQASLVSPAIEEDEIIDAQMVPEAPMSPAPLAHQGMYGHPPAQQNFLQQDYTQQPHQHQPYPQPHSQLPALIKIGKRTPTNAKFFRVAFAIQGVIGAGMLIAILILAAIRLPAKLETWEQGIGYQSLKGQSANDAFLGNHPELIGLIFIGISLVAFVRGFWGLQTRSFVTKFGLMLKGDQAVGMAKFFIFFGGLIAFAGMGFILKYLLH